MTLHFDTEALEEYRDAVLYSEQRFGLGEEFVQAVETALEILSHDPEKFQAAGNDVRIFRMQRFPYYLFYHYTSATESITIYAIAHHRRKSGYWKSRLT